MGETKRAIIAVGLNDIFSATALRTLKKNFRDTLLVSHLNVKTALNRP